MVEQKRSLYQCFNPRVLFDRIYCAAGYRLNPKNRDGTINIERLARGEPLELASCQLCQGYDEMGPPVPKDERGWVKPLEVRKCEK